MDVTMQYNGYNAKNVAMSLGIRYAFLNFANILVFESKKFHTTVKTSLMVVPEPGDYIRVHDDGGLSIVKPRDLNKTKSRVIPCFEKSKR